MLKLNRRYFYSISLFTGAVLLILFSDYTFSAAALLILLRQSAILGLMSIGMGMVMLTGSIDLSAGAVLSLGSSVCCVILVYSPDTVLLSVVTALAVCTLCGFLNGILITSLSLPAAILTFTMALVYTGLSFLSKARMAKWLAPSAFCSTFNGNIGIVPTGAMLWFILLALASLIMRFTYWGQYIYAIGENEQALLMLGVQTKWYKICTHTICGFFSGLAGIFMLARISAPSISTNFPLCAGGPDRSVLRRHPFFRLNGKAVGTPSGHTDPDLPEGMHDYLRVSLGCAKPDSSPAFFNIPGNRPPKAVTAPSRRQHMKHAGFQETRFTENQYQLFQ